MAFYFFFWMDGVFGICDSVFGIWAGTFGINLIMTMTTMIMTLVSSQSSSSSHHQHNHDQFPPPPTVQQLALSEKPFGKMFLPSTLLSLLHSLTLVSGNLLSDDQTTRRPRKGKGIEEENGKILIHAQDPKILGSLNPRILES